MSHYDFMPWWKECFSYNHNEGEEVVLYRHRVTQTTRRVWYNYE